MKIVRDSSVDEAVLEWLKAELDSERFGGDLRAALARAQCDETIIRAADLHDAQANQKRWRILTDYRDWLDRDLNDYDWQWVELDQNEVGSLDYINYSYWNELSDNTRKVKRAAANIANGKVVFDVPNDRFWAVAQAVEAGGALPPIIVVSGPGDTPGEILEGHVRATGYVLARQTVRPLTAVWGRR